jgi:hypothetical protein
MEYLVLERLGLAWDEHIVSEKEHGPARMEKLVDMTVCI